MARQNFARRMGPFVRVSINASAHCRGLFFENFCNDVKCGALDVRSGEILGLGSGTGAEEQP